MIEVSGRQYLAYLIDTNFLSEMLKDPDGFGRKVLSIILPAGVLVLHPVSLWEIACRPELLRQFKDVYVDLFTVLFLDRDRVIAEEVRNYGNKLPIALDKVGILLNRDYYASAGYDLLGILEKHIPETAVARYSADQEAAFQRIVNGDIGGFLEPEEFREKKKVAVSAGLFAFQLLAEYSLTDARNLSEEHGTVDPFNFPSLLSQSFIYHYKFYYPKRKGEPSDFSDILICSALPYVDFFLTERGLASAIRQIQSRHGFLKELVVKTFESFRNNA